MSKLSFGNIIIFCIVLNFASGLIMLAIPAFSDVPEHGELINDYNVTYSNKFIDIVGSNFSSAESPDSSSDRSNFDSIALNIGSFIAKGFNEYIYGFITVLQRAFGGIITPQKLNNRIFFALKTILSLMYLLFVITFFSGKELWS